MQLINDIEIRLAVEDDFETIFSIWMDGIENSFNKDLIDEAILKEKFSRNFQNRCGIFNYWVAIKDNEILGWQSLTKFSYNPFKENIYAESSTYISRKCRFKGIGQLLIGYVMQQAEKSQLEYIAGFVSTANMAARKITKETGWVEIGEMPLSLKGDNSYTKMMLIRPV